jgi:hypothetical protein
VREVNEAINIVKDKNKLRAILRILSKGFIEYHTLSKEAGISFEASQLLISILLSMGYLREMKAGFSCNICPLKPICKGRCPIPGGKVFILTEKALSILTSHTSSSVPRKTNPKPHIP